MGNIWPFPLVREPWSNIVNATATQCSEYLSYRKDGEIAVLSSAAAIFILLNLILNWSILRTKTLKVVIPVDLLDSSPFRLVYCLVMTLWAADVVQDLFDRDNFYRSSNQFIDGAKFFGLSPMVIFLRQALMYFPVLACINSSIPVLDHYIGFFYTLLLGSYNVFREYVMLRGCSYRGGFSDQDIAISLCVKLPVYIGYIVTACWFFFHATMETVLIIFGKLSYNKQMYDLYNSRKQFETRVKILLQKAPVKSPTYSPQKYHKMWKNVCSYAFSGLDYVLPFNSGFKYPLSFLAAMTMAWMVMYQLCVQVMNIEVKFARNVRTFMDSFNITVETLEKFFPGWGPQLDDLWYDMKSFAMAMRIILPYGTAVGFGCCGFFTMYLVQNFHKRLVRAYRGDISFLVASEPLPSKAYIVAASMKFTAFQMGYTAFSFIIYALMEVSLTSFGLVFYYLFKRATFMTFHMVFFFLFPMMWGAALHYVQLFLCRYVFVDYEKRDSGDLITIKYVSFYKFLTYILFFFNMQFAILMSFLRIFTLMMFTVVMYMRIDWDVYMRGLEGWDFGHRTYVGYMFLEYTRNNAVVRTFAHFLLDAVKHRKDLSKAVRSRSPYGIQRKDRDCSVESNETTNLLTNGKPTVLVTGAGIHNRKRSSVREKEQSAVIKDDGSRISRLARNRWQVAYTLLHNPQLKPLRANQIAQQTTMAITGTYLEGSDYGTPL